ncbi:hypothetical protein [Pontibacter liquoris]|uniref:hypothetical protein n=1 Tax=Pontibacter liquoris TaxID=2905677 RepID=UPI001FA80953|nr:hypothetical protein [Pontibacter liquoris]
MTRKDRENAEETPNKTNNVNSDYNKRVSHHNHPDPSAKRNMGPGGETERPGQKDKLENLEIGGNETTGYGANTKDSIESFAQGPGFEYEGSDTAMDDKVNGIRRGEQLFGEDEKQDDDADYSRR